MVPAKAAVLSAAMVASVARVMLFICSPGCKSDSCYSALVDEFKGSDQSIRPEWSGEAKPRCRVVDNLLRPDLILQRSLDVGVYQELRARREAITRRRIGREEGRSWRCSGIVLKEVDAIRGRLHLVPAHDGHHPRQHQIVGFHKAATERRRRSAHKAGNSCRLARGHWHKIVIVGGHVHAKQVEGSVVEIDVSAYAVKGFTRGKYGWSNSIGLHAGKVLCRASVEAECTQREECVVARTHRACSLHAVAAYRISLEVEAIDKPSIHILEVAVGVE